MRPFIALWSVMKITILAKLKAMKLIAEVSVINHFNMAGIDLNLLKVFLVLYQEQNVTRAAEKLCLGQPAVSAALKRLRQVYDDPLFERTQAGMKPTARAILLRPMIQEALDKIELSLSPRLENDVRRQIRTVTLGLSDDYEMAFGRPLVQLIQQQAPGFHIVFQQTNRERVEQAVMTHQVDLAITGGSIKDDRIRRQTLGQAGYLCLYDPTFRSDPAPIGLEEFLARKHLLISFSGLTGAVDDALEEMEQKRLVQMSSSHFAAVPFLLKGTDALCTIPDFAARAVAASSGLSLSFCPVRMPAFSVELCWHYDAVRDPALMLVRDIIAGYLSDALSVEHKTDSKQAIKPVDHHRQVGQQVKQ